MTTFGLTPKSASGRAVLAGLIVALGVMAGQVHATHGGATASAAPVPSFIAGWAEVEPNGTIYRQTNVVNVVRAAPGVYRVQMGGNVSACTYQATIGVWIPSVPPPGQVSVAPLPSPDGVAVLTYNSAGALADLPFHLLVVCS